MFNYWQYTLSYIVWTFQYADVQTSYAISAAAQLLSSRLSHVAQYSSIV